VFSTSTFLLSLLDRIHPTCRNQLKPPTHFYPQHSKEQLMHGTLCHQIFVMLSPFCRSKQLLNLLILRNF
jgi:hypothetical protein